ncbi:putative polyketide synthase [Gordonia effusa NBRC 100432]|uniref:Putative polyketide synthase n=2 Tax=Gordonia effusa TaxID=263908 RepID=H0R6L3_9ACTN|nr:putative polyketide synthase [Gordonia effusa NBRC 100432]
MSTQPGHAGIAGAPGVSPRVDVAIVGIGCRLPGASTPDALWELLSAERSSIGESELHGRPGGFFSAHDQMDADFFGISAAEAAATDPQQRLMLELAWETIENSRTSPHDLAGKNVGVFVGAMHGDYENLMTSAVATPPRHSLVGLNRGMLANRISHFLGLRGPSLTVDTGQSSSLCAVHLAVHSIRRGECSEALAGGVNLALSQRETQTAEMFGALSPDNLCHVFDAEANGYARGEGGAVIRLKPLAAALASGDHVYAVIAGSAMNSDGSTERGLTTPSVIGQSDVLEAALRDAQVAPSDVDYVELHGTGTPVGDPIEARAIGKVFGAEIRRTGPLLVGSVKTNIGHLEAAAGVAGLIKVALSLNAAVVPASLNFENPNPDIAFRELQIEVVDSVRSLPRGPQTFAGVSSFGMGGTNCHVVLAAAPPIPTYATAEPSATEPSASPVGLPLVVTAASDTSLRNRAATLANLCSTGVRPDLGELAYSLIATRARHDQRAIVIASGLEDARAGFEALARGSNDRVISGRVRRARSGQAGLSAFAFPGQGSQRPGMARELYRSDTRFAWHLDTVLDALEPNVDGDLRNLLIGTEVTEAIHRTEFAQPALFAIELSWFRLLRDHGVEPNYLIGHSVGELTAACASEVLDLTDAAHLVAERGRLMQSATADGAMLAVSAPEATVRKSLDGIPGLEIAAVNSDVSTVVSGNRAAVIILADHLTRLEYKTTLLKVSHAFHSAHMEPAAQEFRKILQDITFHEPRIPIVSTMTGSPLTEADLRDRSYFAEQLRGAVRFRDGISHLIDSGVTCIVEAGPGSALSGAIRTTAGDRVQTVPVQRQDHSDVIRTLAELDCAGLPVSWHEFVSPQRRISLPLYPFDRTSHWFIGDTSPGNTSSRQPSTTRKNHDETRPPAIAHRADDLVRSALRAVLGSTVDDERLEVDFTALGMDSLGVVEFRDELSSRVGAPVPATLVFDHPTPRAVIEYLSSHQEGPATAGTDDGAERSTRTTDDDVVIVSTAGRWPSGTESPEALWEGLCAGHDLTGPLPADRGWELESLRITDPSGDSAPMRGGFLYDAADFDADFFGIGPREAAAMDPQQRLTLESTWSCIYRAGIRVRDLRGSATGVFIGAVAQEYGPRMAAADSSTRGHVLTGTTSSVVSGRVAYHFGFHGPTLTVDTACSSSLVALHLARRALQSGDCDLAVAGGVTVMSTPGMFTEFDRQGGLAADGRCKPFSDDADGTSWGEAVVTVLLERRADAIANGHRILATVRGSAINSDGASNGLTAPSGLAQQRVIRAALRDAGVRADEVAVVETHGTGTALGDPIEAGALAATYGRAPGRSQPVLIGSVKANTGHTQAAAGLTGVVKMLGALRTGIVPSTINVDTPTHLFDWRDSNLSIHRGHQPASWPTENGERIGAVSSFGISGTNAHVILQHAPAEDVPECPAEVHPDAPIIFSARSGDALRHYASRLSEALSSADGDHPAIVGELARIDGAFSHRAVVHGPRDAMVAALRTIADGGISPNAAIAGIAGIGSRTRAFVFSGQGSQRLEMGLALAKSQPKFAARLHAVADYLDNHLPEPLLDVLAGNAVTGRVDDTRYAQPGIFAVEVALCEWLGDLGVRADYVAGHSVGELAAAYVAGMMSLDDACRVVTARGALMAAVTTAGAMAAIEADEAETRAAIAAINGVGIAAINAPLSTVISGDVAAVTDVSQKFRESGRKVRALTVSHAFHSHHMESALAEFRQVVETVNFAAPTIPLVSGLTGEIVTEATTLDADYWVSHLRDTVRFADVVQTLRREGVHTFLEIGPSAAVAPMIDQTLAASTPAPSDPPGGSDYLVVSTFTHRHAEPTAIMRTLEALYLDGVDVAWPAVMPSKPVDSQPSPDYPFTRKRFWSSGEAATPGRHAILGSVVRGADGGLLGVGAVSGATIPWVDDHRIGGTVLFAGTGFLDLAAYAAREISGEVIEINLIAPMLLADSDRLVEIRVDPADDGQSQPEWSFEIRSRTATSDWIQHAAGRIGASDAAPGHPRSDVTSGFDSEQPTPPEDLYRELRSAGYEYGPALRNVAECQPSPEVSYCRITMPPSAAMSEYLLHPAMMDAALHTLVLTMVREGLGRVIPAQFIGIRIHQVPPRTTYARLTRTGTYSAAIAVFAPDGTRVADIDEVVMLPVATGQQQLAGSPGMIIWEDGRVVSDSIDPDFAVATISDRPGETLGEVAGTIAGRVILLPQTQGGSALPEAVHSQLHRYTAVLREWVSDGWWAQSELIVVIPNSTAAQDDPYGPIGLRPVRGLVRAAQLEHPGRFRLVTTDAPVDPGMVAAAASSDTSSEITLFADRIRRPTTVPVEIDETRRPDLRDGTVLVTGASGGLAPTVCRYLAESAGVRSFLLVGGRRSPDGLADELRSAGAQVEVVRCDLSDGAAVADLVAAAPPTAPLHAVFHLAGTLDDALLSNITADALDTVLRSKADSAWHLHTATAGIDLRAFVLFSSMVATTGNVGQGAYAAANAFLDGLAAARHAAGLTATSIAWGLWSGTEGMGESLTSAARTRLEQSGVGTVNAADATTMLDAALASTSIHVLASSAWPHCLSEQIRPPRQELTEDPSTPRASTNAPPPGAGRDPHQPPQPTTADVARFVRTAVASALGFHSPSEVDPHRGFLDMGVDSLAAVELRNQISRAYALTLPATLILDQPTVNDVVAFVSGLLNERSDSTDTSPEAPTFDLDDLLAHVDRLSSTLESAAAGHLANQLRALSDKLSPAARVAGADLTSTTDDEMFALIDDELGLSRNEAR